MIKSDKLNFYFKKNKLILDNLDFKVCKGEVHSLLGHNGAGKTTLLKLIIGLLKPTEGKITIEDQEAYKYKSIIGYLPETNGIYHRLTAYQNMEFVGRINKIHKDDLKLKIERLLKLFNLLDKKEDYVSTFSNGMKKRLALACVLIGDPQIILLDEPTNAIDPESLEILIRTIKQLNEKGKTIICVSHNLDFVNRISTNVSILENGRLIFTSEVSSLEGDLKDIYLNKLKIKKQEELWE